MAPYVFCPNPQCAMYGKIDGPQIERRRSGGVRCLACGGNYSLVQASLFSRKRTDFNRVVDIVASLLRERLSPTVALANLGSKDKRLVTSWLLSALSREDAFADVMETRGGVPRTDTRMLLDSVLSQLKFRVDHSLRKETRFHTRSWDNQLAIRYILRLHHGRSVEAMTLLHYKGTRVRDLTVEISNMRGCPIGCTFCASQDITPVAPLDATDYVAQVNTCLNAEGIAPAQYSRFYVSFAGIGEPSLVADNVARGAQWICRLYSHVRFNIATFGLNLEAFRTWKSARLPIRRIQLPYYHHEKHQLAQIVPHAEHYDLLQALAGARELSQSIPGCKLKVNYIVMAGVNDHDSDTDAFIHYLEPFRRDVIVKLSFLNPTHATARLRLTSPKATRLSKMVQKLQRNGFEAYVFGTEFDCMVGCGQLVGNRHSEE